MFPALLCNTLIATIIETHCYVGILGCTLKLGVVSVAADGQDGITNGVSQSAPSKDIDDVEPRGIVSLHNARHFYGPCVPSLSVSDAILHGQALPGHIVPLERKENDSAQKEEGCGAGNDYGGGSEVSASAGFDNSEAGLASEGSARLHRQGLQARKLCRENACGSGKCGHVLYEGC